MSDPPGEGYASQVARIGTLFATVFGRPIDADVLFWRYAAHPSGLVTSLTETVGDDIVAHLGSTPTPFASDAGSWRAARAGTGWGPACCTTPATTSTMT